MASIAAGRTTAESGAGVLVLPDLGSAVLTVLVMLEDLRGAHVLLADAPFVEGAVAATVTAACGDLRAVVREAVAALIAIPKKAAHVRG